MSNDNSKTEIYLNPSAQKENYIITPLLFTSKQTSYLQPMSSFSIDDIISRMNLKVVKRTQRFSNTLHPMWRGMTNTPTDTVLVELSSDEATQVQKNLPSNFSITKDTELSYGGPITRKQPYIKPFYLAENTLTRKFQVRIIDQHEKPLNNIPVSLYGNAEGQYSNGITDDKGEVILEMQVSDKSNPRLLEVTPKDSYWDFSLLNPQMDENNIYIVKLYSFADNPTQTPLGWGQKLMGLDKLPKEINGAGVKIAIIDSGCDTTHPILKHIQFGQNLTSNGNSSEWNTDTYGHGTHCAGIIAGYNEEYALRGFAPGAEVHILKIFPDGTIKNFQDAITYCLEHQIDIVNMSLGTDSEILPGIEEYLAVAVQNGIACIVAAGNSGKTVSYPASSPYTFAVAAIGDAKELKPNTPDLTTIQQGLVTADGIFSPNFTCFGPKIAVCAPGVDIISAAKDGKFVSMSGTSMAAPHITGLAALLLAHHPLFQGQFRQRGPQRVSALFNLICSLCTPSPLGSNRTGAGLPKIDQIISFLQNKQSLYPEMPTVAAGYQIPSVITPQLRPESYINTGYYFY
ncbi:TPA: S8 family serine peptidase [Bacillus cereus]|nr:S8 family serine peptidase [Bacillus cereus]